MDPNVKTDKEGYRKLGRKAFFFLALERCTSSLLLIILECVLLVVRLGQTASFTASASRAIGLKALLSINVALNWALLIVPILLVLAILLCLSAAYTSYSSLRYRIDDSGFALEKGIISKDRVSLPFRQVQNVDIEQSFIYRIFGMCNMVILTAGREDKPNAADDESEIILPALSFTDAKEIQHYLLERANVEEVSNIATPATSVAASTGTPTTPLTPIV